MSGPVFSRNIRAALVLASAGARIFPAWPLFNKVTQRWNKPPCISGWQSLATHDPGQIQTWWREYPDAVPAICCDEFVVVDADRHRDCPDGVEALTSLARRYGEWPDHPVVQTPSSGEHHYFSQPEPALGNGSGQLPPGIDIRGRGGFVIGPGAVLPDGTGWQTAPDLSVDMPQLPVWLLRMIRADEIQRTNCNGVSSQPLVTTRERQYAMAVLEAGCRDVANAPRGKRNIVLNSVAYRLGRMVARGWIGRNEVQQGLVGASYQLNKEDGSAAVRATIKSGLDAGYRKPYPDLTERVL